MEDICKNHLQSDNNYHRYVEQKFLEGLTNTVTLLNEISKGSNLERIGELAEGLFSNYLYLILVDIEDGKREHKNGTV